MPQPRDTFPNALEAIVLVVCLFATELLIGLALHDARGFLGVDPQDLGASTTVLANGILFTVLVRYSGAGYAPIFHSSKASARAVMALLALPILCLVPALVMAVQAIELVLVDLFPLSLADEVMFERMTSSGPASVLMVCLVAPMVEEMLFRGVILRSFLRQYGRWPAIVGAALLFGLAHMNVYQFAVGLMIGTVSGWLYERSQSLWPSILLHGAYNTAVMVASAPAVGELYDDWMQAPATWLTVFALAFAATTMLQRLLATRKA